MSHMDRIEGAKEKTNFHSNILLSGLIGSSAFLVLVEKDVILNYGRYTHFPSTIYFYQKEGIS